jgi:hypothetical protein
MRVIAGSNPVMGCGAEAALLRAYSAADDIGLLLLELDGVSDPKSDGLLSLRL